jgi:hypothetical protein
MAITDNYKRILPVTSMGTPELAYFVVDMGLDIETNYSASDSLYSKAVRGLQEKTDLYMVGTPSGNIFTFAARASSIPGAEAGAISGTIASLGVDIANFCGEKTIVSYSLATGNDGNTSHGYAVGDIITYANDCSFRVTAISGNGSGGYPVGYGPVTAGVMVLSGEWPAGSTNTNTGLQTNGLGGQGCTWNITLGLGGVEVYNASIVGGNLVWND